MRHLFGGRRRRLAISVAVLFMTAGGIAYATIPGSGNVYSACMLKSVGTIRLIDPSLPSSNLMSHCTALEAPISWNQQGQTGAARAHRATAGVSPTVAQLSPGDSHCPTGGAAITGASGSTAYVCSGQNGADGQPFTGTFTSPNGQFSLTVADTGVRSRVRTRRSPCRAAAASTSRAPEPCRSRAVRSIRVANSENVAVGGDLDVSVGRDETHSVAHDRTTAVDHSDTVHIFGDRTQTVDNNETLTVHGSRTETVDHNQAITIHGSRAERVDVNENVVVGAARTETVGGSASLDVGGNRDENVGVALDVQAGGALNLRGSLVRINDGSVGLPAGRTGRRPGQYVRGRDPHGLGVGLRRPLNVAGRRVSTVVCSPSPSLRPVGLRAYALLHVRLRSCDGDRDARSRSTASTSRSSSTTSSTS